jgi:hypothetical protein
MLWLSLSPAAAAGTIVPLFEGDVVADGARQVAVELWIPGISAGDRVKVKSADAQVIAVQQGEGGRTWVTLLPASKPAGGALSLEVKVRGGVSLDEVVEVPVAAAPRGALSIALEPAAIALGEGTVTVRVSPGEGHLPPADRPVALDASVGSLSDPVFDGSAWVARYTPPAGLSEPVAALITASDLTAPEQVVGAVTLPISTSRGKAFAPVDDGAQLGFAPLPAGLKVPAETDRVAWLYASAPDGSPLTGAADLTVSGPGQPRVEEAGGGWYRVRYEAPQKGRDWTLSARMGAASDTLAGRSVAGLPRITLAADAEALSGQGQQLTLTLRAKDPTGAALTGLKTTLEASGAAASTYLADKGDGSYTQTFWVNPGVSEVQLYATPSIETSALPPARLVVWSDTATLPADGASSGRIRVVAEDAFGLPVANTRLGLAVPVGDGSLPPEVSTGAVGVATATYTAGREVGACRVEARLGDLRGGGLAWQGAAPVADTGDPQLAARVDAWRQATPALRLVNPEALAAAATAAATEATGGAPASSTASSTASDTASATGDAAADAADAAPARSGGGLSLPSSSGEHPLARLRLGGLSQSLDYSLVAANDATSLPANTSYSLPLTSGVLGLSVSGEFWPDRGRLGADARLVVGSYDLGGEADSQDTINTAMLGARGRLGADGPADAYAGAWLHSFHTVIFRYAETEDLEAGTPDMITYPRVGLRTAIGGTYDLGVVGLRAELGASWAPYPVERSLGLLVDYTGLHDLWMISAGWEGAWRSMSLVIGEDDASLSESRGALTVQAGLRY